MNARVRAFQELRRALVEAGCFTPAPARAVASALVHVAAAFALYARAAQLVWPLAAILCVAAAFVFHRLGWIMHDAAHGGVFGTRRADRIFSVVVACTMGELVSGWNHGHNAHHAAPNVRGRDGDQAERDDVTRRYRTSVGAAVGLFLFSKFKGVMLPKSTLLLGLRDSVYCYIYARRNFTVEALGALCGFALQLAWLWLWFGPGWGVLVFLLHTAVGLVYLNAVFAGNHYDLERFDAAAAAALDFPSLQLRTTRNYVDGWVTRFVCGGLEYQIEHHLFPNMPRHQLRRAAPHVEAFARAQGLPYEALPFTAALARVVRFHVDTPLRTAA